MWPIILNDNLPADNFYEDNYRCIWSTITNSSIDHANGGWHENLTANLVPDHTLFPGKSNIYHALQRMPNSLFPGNSQSDEGHQGQAAARTEPSVATPENRMATTCPNALKIGRELGYRRGESCSIGAPCFAVDEDHGL